MCQIWMHQGGELPDEPFEPEAQEIGDFYVVLERRATDVQATKLEEGSSGTWTIQF